MKLLHKYGYVINVMADDHPGIVAAAGGAICQAGGSIDTCSQTVVAGYFTLIMVVSFPEPTEPDRLRDLLGASAESEGAVQVQIRPYQPSMPDKAQAAGGAFVLTAFGPPRADAVTRFSRLLAHKGVNIVDLYGETSGDRFVLIGQLDTPPTTDLAMLGADLEHLANELEYAVRLQHENVFVATNQIRLKFTH